MNEVFRVYISPDKLGIELGGSLKNVIALACGISDGLELGDNAKAALITRGIAEMKRLGVAMGGVGSDAAVEASDLVLLKDDLSGLPRALKIARRTISIARQNIAFALIVKFGVMLLSIPGIANMWMAVFADSGVAMLCVLNSIRMLYQKDNKREK